MPDLQLSFDPFAAIESHCDALAEVAREHLDAPVEHCPGWTVADLLGHLVDVHWFWTTIARERLDAPPPEERRPSAPEAGELVDAFRSGAAALVSVLRAANPADAVWTWAPSRHDVAFIIRHQVQEAAVHHFDAARAAGERIVIEDAVAEDSIEEFLTFSVSSEEDPATPPRPPLQGRLVLQCADAGPAWTIGDGAAPGTVRFGHGADADVPTITAAASDLLLWLYGRVELDTAHVPPELVERFRALCFTD